MSKKYVKWLSVGLSAFLLAACGAGETKSSSAESTAEESSTAASTTEGANTETGDYSVAMITDIGGVDDKSFNQSAWEGLQAWGEENGKTKGKGGYDYFQSNADSDFVPNLNNAVQQGYNIIFGIGFKIQQAVQDVAEQNPDTHFALVDSVITGDNTVSVLFKDHEAAFLAGVAAAKATESNKIGFVGGQTGDVIGRFEAGYVAGAKAVNPDIEVDIKYAESFGDAPKGQTIANGMITQGVDVIFQAAGETGNGVFSAAKAVKEANPDQTIWVIGVDRDQHDEGAYNGGNLTLTSTLKGVGQAVKDISNKDLNGEFPAGEVLNYGLKEDGVGLSDGQLDDETKTLVEDYKKQIIDGSLTVPDKPEK